MAAVIEVRLPRRFYDDHVDRMDDGADAPVGTLLRSTKAHHFVQLDEAAFRELLSDARHYSDDYPEFPGLMASARATVRALEATGSPWCKAAR